MRPLAYTKRYREYYVVLDTLLDHPAEFVAAVRVKNVT
jgi:hypothetical protein